MFRRSALFAAVAVAAMAAPATAQGPWDPWIGCWDLVPRVTSGEAPSRVCVLPTSSGSVVEMASVVGDSIVSRQRLDASVEKRDVVRDDCNGFESVQATGIRVYLRTSLKCGTTGRLVNGVMAMSSGGEWIDVQGVAFGSNVGVRAARYRETPATTLLPAEVMTRLQGRPRGMHVARIAATGPVRPSDVVEATKHLEVGVLQTWLAERGQGFGLNASQLVALEASGVAPSVIDIMVALSYPEVFALDRTRLGEAPPDLRGEEREVYGGTMYDGYGWGYDPYGIGVGRGYGWYPGRQPVVVVRAPSGEVTEDEHGKVVKGRGYVSGRGSSARSGEERSGGGSSASGRSGSSGSSGGSADKGSSTGRKAKPKP